MFFRFFVREYYDRIRNHRTQGRRLAAEVTVVYGWLIRVRGTCLVVCPTRPDTAARIVIGYVGVLILCGPGVIIAGWKVSRRSKCVATLLAPAFAFALLRMTYWHSYASSWPILSASHVTVVGMLSMGICAVLLSISGLLLWIGLPPQTVLNSYLAKIIGSSRSAHSRNLPAILEKLTLVKTQTVELTWIVAVTVMFSVAALTVVRTAQLMSRW